MLYRQYDILKSRLFQNIVLACRYRAILKSRLYSQYDIHKSQFYNQSTQRFEDDYTITIEICENI